MNPRTRNILIIIAILLISASLVMDVYAADAVVVKDGDDVVQTISGKLFVGAGISINGSWITLFNVRFPEGGSIVTFPASQVTMVYHKGEMAHHQPQQ